MTKPIEDYKFLIHKNYLIDSTKNILEKLYNLSHESYAAMIDKSELNVFIIHTEDNERFLFQQLALKYDFDLMQLDIKKPFELFGFQIQFIYRDLK